MENYRQLKARLAEIGDVLRAAQLLGWDQQTHMPPAGAEARAYQLGTLSRIAHDMLVADETRRLIEATAAEVNGAGYDSEEASLLRVARRDYDQEARLPSDFVAEFAQATTLAHAVWAKARAENKFQNFAPTLEKILGLTRRLAEYLGYTDHIYDALLDRFEPGMKTAQVRAIFAELKQGLAPLVQAISERLGAVDDTVLHREFDEDRQRDFSYEVIKQFGYDFTRGRVDRAVHPFQTNFSINDVRITTRYDRNFFNTALFGAMHETGHALYELGVDSALERTPLAAGASLGVHESQSRLWENIVGRSRGFWKHFYPALQRTFPTPLGPVSLDTFYRAINKVQPSFIRVEADEVTYNLHIMLRFELEQELLDGKVKVADLPEVWNARMRAYLGITPPTDALGVLQDVHWSSGLLGYFATYALGNLISVQLWDRAVADVPDIPAQIERGEFGPLREWLRQHVHQYGRKYMPDELVRRVTGESIQSRSYLRYLKTKYGAIYGL
ncbi:MAG TPA: carboxypeptidase M32 [Anaerolineae bacterium]|nr:carboxypeptidase M32 [Anaerolineae bacterium]